MKDQRNKHSTDEVYYSILDISKIRINILTPQAAGCGFAGFVANPFYLTPWRSWFSLIRLHQGFLRSVRFRIQLFQHDFLCILIQFMNYIRPYPEIWIFATICINIHFGLSLDERREIVTLLTKNRIMDREFEVAMSHYSRSRSNGSHSSVHCSPHRHQSKNRPNATTKKK